MSEQQLKNLYQTNKKEFNEIYEKEYKENGFGALFMDILKNELKVYYLNFEKIPDEFKKKIKKDKKNIIMISDDFILYIRE